MPPWYLSCLLGMLLFLWQTILHVCLLAEFFTHRLDSSGCMSPLSLLPTFCRKHSMDAFVTVDG